MTCLKTNTEAAVPQPLGRLTAREVTVTPAGASKAVAITATASGTDPSVNGGEFLTLALAGCYGNDICRDAPFEGVGAAAFDIAHAARVASLGTPEQIDRLQRETDAIAEAHNTASTGLRVKLIRWDAER